MQPSLNILIFASNISGPLQVRGSQRKQGRLGETPVELCSVSSRALQRHAWTQRIKRPYGVPKLSAFLCRPYIALLGADLTLTRRMR